MTIDFRVAVDWNDNGYINWYQDADAESDPLNFRENALIGDKTVTNGTVVNTANDYGLDYVLATAPGVSGVNLGNNAGIGEYVLGSSIQYTCTMWVRKTGGSDSGKRVQLIVRETTSGSATILQTTSSSQIDIPTFWYKMSVTFTTTATTERVYLQVFSPDGGWTDSYRCSGLMFTAGSTVPGTFNDGAIKVLTHRVIEARWNIGYKTSIVNGAVANENRLECSLYNLDDYIGESKYQDVHRIRIEGSDDSGSTWTRLYTGWTRKWMPIFDTVNPAKHLKFTGVSSRFYLDGINARIGVQESKTMKQIAQAILDEVDLPDGDTLTLTSSNGSTFNYAGQNWREEVDLLRALADTVGGDGFILWFDREDVPNTLSISELNDTTLLTSDFAIGDYLRGSADYRYADPWFNMVEMKVSPRRLTTTSDKKLWRLPESYSIPADDTVTLLARYNDEDSEFQIGARNVTYDSAAFSVGSPTITLTPKSTSCYIDIDNTGGAADTLTDLRIIGQKIRTWDSYFQQRYFSTEVSTNGNNTFSLRYEITDDNDQADTIIGYWLDIFGEKSHRLWSILVLAGHDDSNILDYTVGHEANVAYPNGTTYKHTVIGEEWAWRKNNHYEKRWYLEKHGDAVAAPTRVPAS